MSDSYRLEEKLFADAVVLPAAERAEFLRRACAGDEELAARIEALVREHEAGGDFLESPPERELAEAARQANETVVPAEEAGSRVGRYKLLEVIGEGGCGVVYRAEQTEPVRREVALKIIKLGMDTKAVIARFEAERQALALMDHPNIARALDAGATDTGRPYFVMELVRGTKITEWCDERRLRPEERLRLFVLVCSAVQHAHQKGVIHRDLKPSNILVTSQDGVPVPKVIDFGIAKATQGRLTDHTLFTAFDQFIGTPAYMSPEQAEFSAVDIDTRSDIYSLGVLLYELLTGRTPIDGGELRQAGVDEIRRRIREQETPRPSARLRTLDLAQLTTAAAHRQIEPPKLVHLLSGDLDWIVVRCLEKDRARRYETANALAREIERYLRSEPVTARPPSRVYIMGRFVRRHRFGVAAGGAVAVALLAGITAAMWLYFRETVALRRAELNERKAQTEAARSTEVARFMQEMLRGVAPSVALGRDTRLLRDILEATALRIDAFDTQPGVQADLWVTLAGAYVGLGEYTKAVGLHERALAQRRTLYPADHPKIAESLYGLGATLRSMRQNTEAEKLQREALAIFAKIHGPASQPVAEAVNQIAKSIQSQGRLVEAEAVFREALEIARGLPGDNRSALARSLFDLGWNIQKQERFADSEPFFRESLDLISGGKLTPEWAIRRSAVLNQLGLTLTNLGLHRPERLQEAEGVLREALAIERQYLAVDHTEVGHTLNKLGIMLRFAGRLEESIAVHREALALRRKSREREPQMAEFAQSVLTSLTHLTQLHMDLKQPEAAEKFLQEGIVILRESLSGERTQMVSSLRQLGLLQVSLKRPKEAEGAFREAFATGIEVAEPRIDQAIVGLDRLLAPLGRATEVDPLWQQMIEQCGRLDPRQEEGVFVTHTVGSLNRAGRFALAEALAREHLARWEAKAPDDWHAFAFRTSLGIALARQRKFAEAEPLLLSGCPGLRERLDLMPTMIHTELRLPFRHLAELYERWGQPERAVEWQRKHAESQTTASTIDRPRER